MDILLGLTLYLLPAIALLDLATGFSKRLMRPRWTRGLTDHQIRVDCLRCFALEGRLPQDAPRSARRFKHVRRPSKTGRPRYDF